MCRRLGGVGAEEGAEVIAAVDYVASRGRRGDVALHLERAAAGRRLAAHLERAVHLPRRRLLELDQLLESGGDPGALGRTSGLSGG